MLYDLYSDSLALLATAHTRWERVDGTGDELIDLKNSLGRLVAFLKDSEQLALHLVVALSEASATQLLDNLEELAEKANALARRAQRAQASFLDSEDGKQDMATLARTARRLEESARIAFSAAAAFDTSSPLLVAAAHAEHPSLSSPSRRASSSPASAGATSPIFPVVSASSVSSSTDAPPPSPSALPARDLAERPDAKPDEPPPAYSASPQGPPPFPLASTSRASLSAGSSSSTGLSSARQRYMSTLSAVKAASTSAGSSSGTEILYQSNDVQSYAFDLSTLSWSSAGRGTLRLEVLHVKAEDRSWRGIDDALYYVAFTSTETGEGGGRGFSNLMNFGNTRLIFNQLTAVGDRPLGADYSACIYSCAKTPTMCETWALVPPGGNARPFMQAYTAAQQASGALVRSSSASLPPRPLNLPLLPNVPPKGQHRPSLMHATCPICEEVVVCMFEGRAEWQRERRCHERCSVCFDCSTPVKPQQGGFASSIPSYTPPPGSSPDLRLCTTHFRHRQTLCYSCKKPRGGPEKCFAESPGPTGYRLHTACASCTHCSTPFRNASYVSSKEIGGLYCSEGCKKARKARWLKK
ncbi:hypothetical protein JCM10207_001251 [Rhodosporidiobolus poonsookiae]